MSSRHRSDIPKPTPSERRVAHHRERQATRRALAVGDPEEIVDPRPPHTLHLEHAGGELADEAVVAPRRFRVWKTPFWKRRTALRHERNAELAGLAGGSPELDEEQAELEQRGEGAAPRAAP